MNILNQHFDKIYCVNLDKRTDRWSHAATQFKKYNIEVKRVSAVEGNPDNLPCISPHLIQYPGAVGCSLSHYKILKEAKELGLSNILIFEDDILFKDDWEKIYTDNYKDIPEDWDMLYLSTNSIYKVITSKVSERISKAHNCLTTHSYAIKSRLFNLAMEHIIKLDQPVDGCYAHYIQPHNNCYIFDPGVCIQMNGFSDIANRHANYSREIL
jgi:GR25 family glycosyltransferase involved in LPS biosynthesis|tara:strand:- start:2178 stop:2813 length:636 start_codon:yes stop_codon:yes gene_type:complete